MCPVYQPLVSKSSTLRAHTRSSSLISSGNWWYGIQCLPPLGPLLGRLVGAASGPVDPLLVRPLGQP